MYWDTLSVKCSRPPILWAVAAYKKGIKQLFGLTQQARCAGYTTLQKWPLKAGEGGEGRERPLLPGLNPKMDNYGDPTRKKMMWKKGEEEEFLKSPASLRASWNSDQSVYE